MSVLIEDHLNTRWALRFVPIENHLLLQKMYGSFEMIHSSNTSVPWNIRCIMGFPPWSMWHWALPVPAGSWDSMDDLTAFWAFKFWTFYQFWQIPTVRNFQMLWSNDNWIGHESREAQTLSRLAKVARSLKTSKTNIWPSYPRSPYEGPKDVKNIILSPNNVGMVESRENYCK